MTSWYADRLRDDAGALEAQIEKLDYWRHHWSMLHYWSEGTDSPLHDTAGEMVDKLSDQIGELQARIDALDDEISEEDPERPYIYRVL